MIIQFIFADLLAAGLGFGMNGVNVIPIWYLAVTIIGLFAGSMLSPFVKSKLPK